MPARAPLSAPALVLAASWFACCVALVALLTLWVPGWERIMQDIGWDQPRPTRVAVAASHALRSSGGAVAAVLAASAPLALALRIRERGAANALVVGLAAGCALLLALTAAAWWATWVLLQAELEHHG